jgi:hypothetical protein
LFGEVCSADEGDVLQASRSRRPGDGQPGSQAGGPAVRVPPQARACAHTVVQRRVLRYGDFPCAGALPRAVTSFIRRWNRDEAHPFNWTFRGHFVHTQRHHAA